MQTKNNRFYVLCVTGLALFAMFFGAGNLIFPVMIGVDAGYSVTSAIFGILCTGVVLPVLGILSTATSTDGINGIASRIGKYPGLIFTLLVFLGTGMLYALPRVGTVSFELAVSPHISQSQKPFALFFYTLVFFAITYFLGLNPKGFVDRIGAWLTPALLILLATLIIAAIIRLPFIGGAPSGDYANSAFASGLLQGYFTMDAAASLVFGIVIIDSLRHSGFSAKRQIFGSTAIAGVIAGAALALVYLGLAAIGSRIADQNPSNGAEGLAIASSLLFGSWGQIVFGLIALLACLTTSVGLSGASTQYFMGLFPKISRPVMLGIHMLVSFALGNLGLEVMLDVVSPLNQFLYPVVICVIIVSLFDVFVPGQLHWAYRLAAWIGAFIGLFEALWSTGLEIFSPLRAWLDVLPLGSVHIPWLVPSAIGFGAGLVIDTVRDRSLWKREQAS